MIHLVPIFLILFSASITPGPNNFLVFHRASNEGFTASIPGIATIVLGSVMMLGLSWWGFSALLQTNSAARLGLTLIGAAYMSWLGLSMLFPPASSKSSFTINGGPAALMTFQLLNPKAWMLVSAACAVALSAPVEVAFPTVAIMTAGVSTLCLMAWAALGAAASSFIRDAAQRRRLEQIMALLLIGSASLLFIQPL